ncbi:site-specific integrase [Bordetella genomosp. 8]|uniref:site-specific integrase n=1 Tax=Bordetella genomosp. 8 TaxID=1416806 RepID=UPI0018DF4508|nr:site-specific integrase [Bordetella genomosp. 8]
MRGTPIKNDHAALSDYEWGQDPRSANAVRALLGEGASPHTVASYRAAVRYLAAWHEQRLGAPFSLPVPVRTVVLFITDHVQHATEHGLAHGLPPDIDTALVGLRVKARTGPLALSTIQHRLAVLSEAHRTRDLPNPCRSRAVQTLLARTRAAYARRGVRPSKKPALTREPLEQLLHTCDESLIGLRDRAMLLFGWASGGRRRSEIVAARVEHLQRTQDGYVYVLRQSKTRQDGADHADMYKPVAGRAAQALDAWLRAAGIAAGPIFRRVRRGGTVCDQALTGEAVRRIVKQRCAAAGLDERYAAHSLRAGFVTEAGRQGVPLAEVMAMTGHASVNSVIGYHRAGAAPTLRAARLLEPDGE